MLSIKIIQEYLTGNWIGREIKYFSEINSSNLKAWDLISQGVPAGTLVITDKQTAGRGRANRTWISSGSGLTFTIILFPQIKAGNVGIYPLLAGITLVEALSVFKIKTKLKWPNDIIMNGKKLGGILCESKLSGSIINQLIMGIGININDRKFPAKLQDRSTSLFIETGLNFEREKILAEFLNKLELNLLKFHNNGQKIILETWQKHCCHLMQYVSFHYGGKIINGKFLGLGSNGAAKIITGDKEQNFSSGEIIL